MRFAGTCVPALLAALLCGCAGRHEASENYVLVTANSKIAYWQEAAQGLLAACSEMKVQCQVAGPENYDPKAEKDAFLSAVHKQTPPSGILVSAADPALMQDAIDTAAAAGIPVLTIDADSPKSKRLMFIGTNNYQAGQMGGEFLAKQLNGKGTIVVYTIAGQGNLEERLEGYKRVLARSPGMKVIDTVDIAGDPNKAFDATKALTDKKSLPDAFVCLEALACREVADVLDRAGIRNKTIVAMDVSEGTLNWLQKGMIQATIAQRPYTMAYFGTNVLDQLHHNKPNAADVGGPHSPVPVFIDTGATLVDKSNVSAFLKPPAGTH